MQPQTQTQSPSIDQIKFCGQMQASPPSSDMAKLSVDGEPTMPKVQIEPIAPSLTPVQEADKRGFAHAQSLHDLLLYTPPPGGASSAHTSEHQGL